MGVRGLWNVIKDSGERVFLGDILLKHRLENGNMMRIGVDMSPFMAECTAAVSAGGVHRQPPGGALSVLFYRLCSFLTHPLVLVFVFDGPNRPAIKRGQTVINRPLVWTDKAKDLIRYFGHHVHEAPGEAEAELGWLSNHALIDGVITSDVDALVFGTNILYRSIQSRDRDFADEYIMYKSQSVGLSLGGLLIFALLSGGDYNKGIEGCGSAVARGIAQCGFGDTLLGAMQGPMNEAEIQEFLGAWRLSLRSELRTNSRGLLGHRASAVADGILDSFPDRNVVDLYIKPLTTWSVVPARIPDAASWVPKSPSLHRIAHFCRNNLGSENEQSLLTRFENNLWEGVFLQMVYSPTALYDNTRKVLATPNFRARIMKATQTDRRGRPADRFGSPQPRLEVSANNFIALFGGTVMPGDSNSFLVWVPEAALPPGIMESTSHSTPASRTRGINIVDHQEAPPGNNTPLGQNRVLDALSRAGLDQVPAVPSTSTHVRRMGEVIDLTRSEIEHRAPRPFPLLHLGLIDLTQPEASSSTAGPSFIDLTADDSD